MRLNAAPCYAAVGTFELLLAVPSDELTCALRQVKGVVRHQGALHTTPLFPLLPGGPVLPAN